MKNHERKFCQRKGSRPARQKPYMTGQDTSNGSCDAYRAQQ